MFEPRYPRQIPVFSTQKVFINKYFHLKSKSYLNSSENNSFLPSDKDKTHKNIENEKLSNKKISLSLKYSNLPLIDEKVFDKEHPVIIENECIFEKKLKLKIKQNLASKKRHKEVNNSEQFKSFNINDFSAYSNINSPKKKILTKKSLHELHELREIKEKRENFLIKSSLGINEINGKIKFPVLFSDKEYMDQINMDNVSRFKKFSKKIVNLKKFYIKKD